MVAGAGLIALGLLMIALAPFGWYHKSWKSPWRLASCGLLLVFVGGLCMAIDVLW